MRSAVYYPPNQIKIEDFPIPTIEDDEILLQVKSCGICGTDVLKINRALPKKPLVLGHEVVGIAEKVGNKVTKFKVGDRIVVAHHVPCGECHYCRHGNHSMCRHFKQSNLVPGGFSEYLKIPGEHVDQTAFKIPNSLTDEEALFTEPLSCCVRNIRRSHLLAGDIAVVVGMGSIGLMTCQLLKLAQVKVLALDLLEERLELAKKLGADEVMEGRDPLVFERIQELSEGRGADLVILTAGGPKVVQDSLTWIRDGGALNLFASLSDDPVPWDIDRLYHHEITVFSSYSPSPEDLKSSFELLANQKVNVKPLITHRLPLEGFQEGIEMINQQKAIKVIIQP